MGRRLEKQNRKGVAVSRTVALTMIKRAMMKAAMRGAKGFLLDGCPSDKICAETFKVEIGRVDVCVYLKVRGTYAEHPDQD